MRSCLDTLTPEDLARFKRLSEERLMLLGQGFNICPSCALRLLITCELEAHNKLVENFDVDRMMYIVMKCLAEATGSKVAVVEEVPKNPKLH